MHRPSRPSGFTLMELLIVIAVIGILAGMIFPAVGYVREKARKDECLNNLRQWGVALQGYLDEHRGIFPTYGATGSGSKPNLKEASAWFNVLPPYIGVDPMKDLVPHVPHPGAGIKSPFLCPTDPNFSDDESGGALSSYYSSYTLNSNAAKCRFSRLTYPASFVVFAEVENGETGGVDPSSLTEKAFRHAQSMNMAFADGHAENVRMNDAWAAGLAATANYGGLQWNPDDSNLGGAGN